MRYWRKQMTIPEDKMQEIKRLALEIEEKQAELALLVARLRRESGVSPGTLLDLKTGKWVEGNDQ